jgi:hydrogenase large subunit
MPIITASIDPVTRIEGHMKVEVKIDTVKGVQQVVDARATGTLFRGFEKMLVGRVPRDAQHVTERICGVCPVSHGLAAVLAVDAACGVTVPNNARVMRNIVMGANFIDSHILHFYLLALADFIEGPGIPPWQPGWNVDKRFDEASSAGLLNHYVTAIDMRRKAHEMGSIFGARLPHPPTFLPGGITAVPKSGHLSSLRSYLNELIPFIQNVYIPDVETVAAVYNDYYSVGRGTGNLLAYGVFDLNAAGTSKLLQRGVSENGSTEVGALDLAAITEKVTYSWYADSTDNLPPASGDTIAQYPKGDAYSWLKAPRYGGKPFECGALSRMWVNGDYTKGISVMDRHRARAYETLKIAQAMQGWVNEVAVGGSVFTRAIAPATAQTIGLTEAPRGALGHWLRIDSSRISRYQVITPTCWNASPRDSLGQPGPLEHSLLGTPVQDSEKPIEVLRVIHSFDPCLDCAVHVVRAEEGARVFAVGHYHGETRHNHTHEHGGSDHGHS